MVKDLSFGKVAEGTVPVVPFFIVHERFDETGVSFDGP
jgi:hypothetical protein